MLKWEWLNNEFMRDLRYYDLDGMGISFTIFMTTLIGLFFGMVLMLFPFSLMYGMESAAAPALGFPLGVVLTHLFTQLNRLHPLSKVPGTQSGYSYYNRVETSHDVLMDYLRLGKKDQKEYFPHNLIETFEKPLADEDREQLVKATRKVLNEIKERNEQTAYFEAKRIPIDHILEELERSHAHVEIESKTLKEFR